MREAPAFAGVPERALLLEGLPVVDESDARLPRQLDDAVLPDGDPLAEVGRVERLHLQDLARREVDLADPRTAVQPGALVEHAVDELEPLRECLGIVRIAAHDLEAVHRRGGAGGCGFRRLLLLAGGGQRERGATDESGGNRRAPRGHWSGTLSGSLFSQRRRDGRSYRISKTEQRSQRSKRRARVRAVGAALRAVCSMKDRKTSGSRTRAACISRSFNRAPAGRLRPAPDGPMGGPLTAMSASRVSSPFPPLAPLLRF